MPPLLQTDGQIFCIIVAWILKNELKMHILCSVKANKNISFSQNAKSIDHKSNKCSFQMFANEYSYAQYLSLHSKI